MKKIISLCLAALLAAGCAANTTTSTASSSSAASSQTTSLEKISDQAFTEFLDTYLVEICEKDITLAEHYFEHPENYGIDLSKAKITLGTFVPTKEDIAFTQKTIDSLNKWDTSQLSKANRQIYEQMLWEAKLDQAAYNPDFTYLGDIWSDSNGVQTNLTDYFSEYRLYSAKDVDILIKLLNDVPRYTEDALAYSRKQAELGFLAIDLDSVTKTCQSILDTKDNSPITSELEAEVDGLNLDASESDKLKKSIRDTLQKSFFPSFEKIITELKKLEKDNHPLQGMANLPKGKEYYALLLKNYSGSEDGPEKMKEDIEAAIDQTIEEYRAITKRKPDVADLVEKAQTPFKNVSEIMPFLEERYPAEFPMVKAMEYEIKPLSNEQSREGTMAYFVTPAIDSDRPYEIRYNKRDYGEDASSLQLYDTFAHEGVPGHMYQTQYNREHFIHPIQYFLGSFGMQEGYATYSAFQTAAWTGIDEDVLKVWKLSELYSNYSVLLMDLQINYDGISKEQFLRNWGDDTGSVYDRLAQNPGLFFGYYYGCYKLEQLQQVAKDALGDAYNPVEFNNTILQAGNVEFGIVEKNVDEYITSVRNDWGSKSESKAKDDNIKK